MTDSHRLAIIGGGASASLLLIHLARQAELPFSSIDVYDRRGNLGRGIAYGTDYAVHRLNVRAANMSALDGIPDDFARWGEGKIGLSPQDFAPRPVYAQYLAEHVHAAMEKLPVSLIASDVLSSQRSKDGFVIETAAGQVVYKSVVQATGNVRLIQPRILGQMTNYAPEPWYKNAYQNIPSENGTVAILGSGLSAVDAIAALDAEGYKGRIAVISRNGWFSCPHVLSSKYPPFDVVGASPSMVMQRLRREVKKAAAEDIPWQAVLDSLRGATNNLWQSWSQHERNIFMRRAFTLWNIHRHRMPPETADIVRSYQAAGRLEKIYGSIEYLEEPDRIVLKTGEVKADLIINAMGYRYDEGRGFEADYKIGPSRFGDLFETTAIPEIRTQAGEIARLLASLSIS